MVSDSIDIKHILYIFVYDTPYRDYTDGEKRLKIPQNAKNDGFWALLPPSVYPNTKYKQKFKICPFLNQKLLRIMPRLITTTFLKCIAFQKGDV